MTIERAPFSRLEDICRIFSDCRSALEMQGIRQWTTAYPTAEIIISDIQAGHLYQLVEGSRIIGVITLNNIQEEAYKSIPWKDNNDQVLVIHRLAVHPSFQGQGFAGKLMDFAEDRAAANGYTSVRLDAYSDNKRVLHFYEQRSYEQRGEVFFPGRAAPFFCYEKQLVQAFG